jgi:hypothetical protein
LATREELFPTSAFSDNFSIRDPEKAREALRMWNPSDVPRWLDEDFH